MPHVFMIEPPPALETNQDVIMSAHLLTIVTLCMH
jgi:hypothetical protein